MSILRNIISKFKGKKEEPFVFNVGEGLDPVQKERADRTLRLSKLKGESETANDKARRLESPLGLAINTVKGLPKTAFNLAKEQVTPREEPVEVRRMFEAEPIKTTAPPIVTGLGKLGFDLLEMGPKGIAMAAGEFNKNRGSGEVNLGFDARRLGFPEAKYKTAEARTNERIQAGEDPLLVALDVGSNTILDLAIGGQIIAGLARKATSLMLKGGVSARLEAKVIQDAFKTNRKEIFKQTKDLPLAQREKVLADITNAKNLAEKTLKKTGAPTSLDPVRQSIASATDILGRQTSLNKGTLSSILRPNIGARKFTAPAPVLNVPKLPGNRPINPEVPNVGLSAQPVERVGGAIPTKANKLIAEGKVRLVGRDGKQVYQVKSGDTWKNVASEAEAVRLMTPTESPTKSLPKKPAAKTKTLAEQAKDFKSVDEFIDSQGEIIYHTTDKKFDKFDRKFLGTQTGDIADNVDRGFFFAENIKDIDDFKATLKAGKENFRGDDLSPKDISKFRTIEKVADKSRFFQLNEREIMNGNIPEKDAEILSKLIGTEDGDVLKGKDAVEHVIEVIDAEMGDLSEFWDIAGDDFIKELKKNGYLGFKTNFGKGVNEFVVLDPNKLSDKSQLTDIFNQAKKTPTKSLPKKTPVKATVVPKTPKSSPVDTTTGEGRSIEILSRQATGALELEGGGLDNVSLPKIIEFTATPVQAKVNSIDTLLRTPKFVMEKIGFSKEAKELRQAMDNYWKELPVNIDKISNWQKQVPSDKSNKDIFKWLDGEAIDLKATELKVATEIKEYLSEWATRLGLPDDNRLAYYITHLFDKELAKEFDETLANIISGKVPGAVYDPFLEKRLGKRGYKQDTWGALEAYVKRGTRKVHMDPVLEKIQGRVGPSIDSDLVEESVFKYIQKYIENINMRPSSLEKGVDNWIKQMIGYKLGSRPTTAITRTLRRLTYRGMLGLNPGSALRNLSQGINTYAELGEKYTAIGYAGLYKKGASEELAREGVLNAGFIEDRVLSSTKKAIKMLDKTLFVFFETAERINRGAAYFGAKAKGLNQGMSEEKAIEFGKETVRKTQFVFDSVDTPVGMSSDIMKTLFQFQTFTTKQIEFLGGKVKGSFFGKEKARNIAGLIRYALAGTAFVYSIGKAFGMKPEELIPFYRLGVPPSLKFPTEVIKAGLNTPDKFGKERDLEKKTEDVSKSAVGLLPAGSQVRKTIIGARSVKEGGSFDKAGRLQFKQGQSLPQKAQSLLFGKFASDNAQNYFNKDEIESKELKKMRPTYKKAQELLANGQAEEAQLLVDGLTDAEYKLYKKIRTAEKADKKIADKKALLPRYTEIQNLKEKSFEEALKAVQELTDEEYELYELIKKDFKNLEDAEAGEKPRFGDTVSDDNSIVKNILIYAEAIGTDPVTAFDRIFDKQRIRRTDSGAIIIERMDMADSEQVKAEREATANMKLDHTIPLQLGGSNKAENLKLVDTEIWANYTPVENFLGKKLRNNEIRKKEAQDLITKFKNGELTAEQVFNYQQ